VTSTTTTTTIKARSTGKAGDFSRECEVEEGEELVEDEEEGELEDDGEGVGDPEGEDELDVVAKYPFTGVALMGSETSPEPG
jgi:hypothetical protein